MIRIRKTRRPVTNTHQPVTLTVDPRSVGLEQAMGVLRTAAEELAVRQQYMTSKRLEWLIPGEVFPEMHLIIRDTRLLYDPTYKDEAYRLTAQLTQCGRKAAIRVTVFTRTGAGTWTVNEPVRSALEAMASVSAKAIAADPAISVQIVQAGILEADPGPETITAALAGETTVDWGSSSVIGNDEFSDNRRDKMRVIRIAVRSRLDRADVLRKLPDTILLVSDDAAIELFGHGFRVGLVHQDGVPAMTDAGRI